MKKLVKPVVLTLQVTLTTRSFPFTLSMCGNNMQLKQQLEFVQRDIEEMRDRIRYMQNELNELYEHRYDLEQQLVQQGEIDSLVF
jgi:TolA-binding protein